MIVGDLPLCSPHYFLSSSVAKLLQSCLNLMKDSVVETSYNRSSRLHMYKRTHTYVVETSYNRSSQLHMYERTRTYVVKRLTIVHHGYTCTNVHVRTWLKRLTITMW